MDDVTPYSFRQLQRHAQQSCPGVDDQEDQAEYLELRGCLVQRTDRAGQDLGELVPGGAEEYR